MTRTLEFHVLDVFTDRVFGGNPLGVFPDAAGLDEGLMQDIAREMNLSETVFLSPPTTPDGTRRVRIFTPAVEVPFAGHPTVGTGWFLVATGAVPADGDAVTVRLDENVGRVPVEVELEGGRPAFARLTTAVLPVHAPVEGTTEDLARLLSLDPEQIGAGELRAETVSTGLPYTIVPVRDRAALERSRLDLPTWDRMLRRSDAHHVYVVTPDEDREADFRVRMYAPGSGVPEDPATGSAAAAFAGYLGRRAPSDGVHAWQLVQGVEMGRPSRLEAEAEVRGGSVTRVRVGGQAVMVSRGTMEVPA